MRYWDRARTTGGYVMILGFGFWVYEGKDACKIRDWRDHWKHFYSIFMDQIILPIGHGHGYG